MCKKFHFCRFYQKLDEGKITQIIAVLTATISLFISGIHGGWTGPSLIKIQSEEYPFNVTADEASYIAIVAPVGNTLGGIIGSSILDVVGRKITILCLVLPQISNFALLYFSYYAKELLYVGRFFGGLMEGATLAVIPVYIAEVTEPKIRGVLGTFITLAYICGKLFINILGSYLDIHTTALICLLFCFIFFVSFIRLPETPYYLLMRKKNVEAENCLKFLRKTDDVTKEVEKLTSDINRQMSESGTWKDLFIIKSNRKAFLLVSGLRLTQQFTGFTALSIYVQILVKEGTNLSPVLGSSLMIALQICANITSTFIIDRLGRRPLFITSISSCFIMLFSLGTFYTLKHYMDLSEILWLPFVFLMLYICSFQIGLGVGMNIFIGEIFSASIKSKALTLGTIIFGGCMMACTKFYQYTADNIGLAVPFYSFAFFSFFGMLFVVFCLPETKGKSLEEIQQELKGK